MATQELEIIVGSQVQDGIKGLSDIDKATGKLATDTAKASASISKSYAQINAAGKALSASNQQLSKSVVNAGGTLTSFSRIVQDAPYGIIGVGNNITQFAEQFQFLRQQTGSSGAALKSLAQSLIGAGGLTLGISLLVTGVTTLIQKYGSLDKAIDAILFPLNEQQRLQKLVNDTIKEGTAAGQQEIVELSKLYRATQNVNVPLGERNKIVDQLQKQYPSYFGNLSNEAILTGNAASQYNKLRDAIIAAATSRAIDKRLEEQATKRLDVLENEESIRKKLSVAVAAQASAEQQLNKLLSQTGPLTKGFVEQQDQLTARLVSASSRVKSLTQDLAANGAGYREIGDAEDRLLSLQDELIVKFGATAAGVKDVTAGLKEQKKAFEELNLASLSVRQDIFQRPEPIKFQQPIDISLVGLKAATERAAAQIGEFRTSVTREIEKVNIDIEKALQSGAATIATGIGSAIGSLVGGAGTLQDAFNSIIGVFADFISQLGQSMIAAGTATIAAKALSTNPATAIVAGVLAVAAGAAIRAALSKTPSFATGGGVVGGPTLAMIGDNPGREEYVIPSEVLDKIGGGEGGFVARAEVSGTTLAIIIERALRQQRRANG